MRLPAPVFRDSVAPGSMVDVRRSNLALVLGAIAGADPGLHPTRAQVAAATGLTKASVSSLVLDLLEAGLLRELGLTARGERGRPGVGLALNTLRAVMGMEINVDYIAAGVLDLSGTVLFKEVRERNNRGSQPDSVLAELALLAARARSTVGEQGVEVVGGGLAVPGLTGPGGARILAAPNLGWTDVDLDLGALLPEAPLVVSLFNEANAAALAELRHRPGGDADFLFVSGEVGVGGGLVVGGELFTGPAGNAGEVGHVVVDPGGNRCSCGGTGCLETVAGQDAIFAAAGLPPGTGRSAAMRSLLDALAGGNAQARAAVERAGTHLGIAVASTARVMDIGAVVLGGHFAVLDEWLRNPLLAGLARYAPGRVADGDVTVAAAGEWGAVLGAAGSALRSLVDAPYLLQA